MLPLTESLAQTNTPHLQGLGLTPDELYSLDLRGYLVVDNAADPVLIDECNAVTDELAQREAVFPLDPAAFQRGEKGNASKLLNIIKEHDCFLRLAMSPRVVSRIPSLVQFPRLKSTWLQLNGPQRGIGYHANHTPHDPVDMYYFQGRVCAALMTVMYALCDVPEEGGALHVIPGSHKSNFPLPEDPVLLDQLRIRLPLKKGQALIFSHDMNHGSCNSLNYVRRSLFTSFSPGSSAHTLGDNDLYGGLFAAAEEGSWQKYLLRKARGDRDTYPQPKHTLADEVQGRWTPEAKRTPQEAALVL